MKSANTHVGDIYNNIQFEYGITCRNTFLKCFRNSRKITNTTKTRNFLLQCKNNKIIPRFVANRTKHLFNHNESSKSSVQLNNFVLRTNMKILRFEIGLTIKKLHELQREKYFIKRKMYRLAPQRICNSFVCKVKICNRAHFEIITRMINKKYDKLVEEQTKVVYYNNEWLKNLSTTEIPKEVELILAMGPKFAVKPTKNEIPIAKMIADVEDVIASNNNQPARNDLRSRTSTTILNYIHTTESTNNHNDILMQQAYKSTKNFLNNNPQLIVTESDKGNVTILMDKTDYDQKMENLFNDNSKYTQLGFNPTQKLEEKCNDLIRGLIKDNHINPNYKKKLLSFTSVAPTPRCNPKIHKEGFRIIINNKNAPTYKLSKYINLLLKPLITNSKYNITNSFQFKQMLDETILQRDDVMVSFDVVSMYESIPIENVLASLTSRKEMITNLTTIPWNTFKMIIRLCAQEANYFTWNGKFYKQKHGLIIGGPVSALLADLVVTDILDMSITELGFEPTLTKKYVDDLIVCLTREEIESFYNILNNIDKKIKFTMETEEKQQLPYLDMVLHRKNNRILTSFYNKPTSKNRILNYNSAHPRGQKAGIAYGTINRMLRITSDCFVEHTKKEIYRILTMNGYPKQLINKSIKKFYQKLRNGDNDPNKTCAVQKNNYKSLTYCPIVAEKLKTILQSDNEVLQIGLKPYKTVSNITKQKRNHKESTSGVVYKFDCGGCDKCYIGQTGQKICKRLQQHEYDSSNAHALKKQTAAAQHTHETGHKFNIKNTKVLTREENWCKRLTMEAIYINLNQKTCVNLRSDLDVLNPSYTSLLKYVKNGK